MFGKGTQLRSVACRTNSRTRVALQIEVCNQHVGVVGSTFCWAEQMCPGIRQVGAARVQQRDAVWLSATAHPRHDRTRWPTTSLTSGRPRRWQR